MASSQHVLLRIGVVRDNSVEQPVEGVCHILHKALMVWRAWAWDNPQRNNVRVQKAHPVQRHNQLGYFTSEKYSSENFTTAAGSSTPTALHTQFTIM
jgi:hypothetical protein